MGNKFDYAAVAITMLISLPIQITLWVHLLTSTNANELLWFLFWVSIPAQILATILTKGLGEK